MKHGVSRGKSKLTGSIVEVRDNLQQKVITRNGEIMPTAIVRLEDSVLAKRFAGLNSIKYDMGSVEELVKFYITEFSQRAGSTMLSGIWTSAVIIYSRCFNSNKRGAKLDYKNCFSDLKLQQFHRQVIDDRNTYHAHMESKNYYEDVIKIELNLKSRTISSIFYSASFNTGPVTITDNNSDAFRLLELVEVATRHATEQLNIIVKKLKIEQENRFEELEGQWLDFKRKHKLI